jgi:hypothetical protein
VDSPECRPPATTGHGGIDLCSAEERRSRKHDLNIPDSRYHATMNTAFASITEHDWKLSERITDTRRERLLRGITFEEIVERIIREARLVRQQREHMGAKSKRRRSSTEEKPRKLCREWYRVVVEIAVSPATVDLFHSSRCGYRAQYYASCANGEEANRYLIDRLMPRIQVLMEEHPKRTCVWTWVEHSLAHSAAKVWIHQSDEWIRPPRKLDMNLNVERWQRHRVDRHSHIGKLIRYGTLTPAYETRIEIKGGFVNDLGGKLPSLKPERNRDLNDFGFT